MMKQPPASYRHTQKGPWSLLLCAIGALMVTLAWLWREEPLVSLVLAITGVVMLLLGPCFHQLTVADEGDRLAIRFGFVPLFQKHIRYTDIQAVEIGRTTLLDGWGIHLSLKGGWVWNISGWDCVVIRHGGSTRVGTDDAEHLAAFLKTKMPLAAPSFEDQS
jgi:hypothetical protein